MELTQQFAIVESLKNYMHEYRTTGSTRLSANDATNLKAVYLDIFKTNINTSCPNCIKHYLNMLESWYEREHTAWVNNQTPPEAIAPVEPKKTRKK